MSGRSDSWYADIEETQLWQLYSMAKRGAQWFEVVAAANTELGLDIHPSRSAYYRWMDYMRGEDAERRLAQARIAALEADGLAKNYGLKDERAVAAYKSLAAEFALKSDAKTASSFMRMAMNLVDRQLHAAEVELKTKDLARKDEELKIALKKLEMLEAEKSKATAALGDAKLTTEDKLAKMREIFG